MNLKVMALSAVVGLAATGLTACGSGSGASDGVIKLGVVAALTGPAAPLGTRQAAGARAAAEAINARGGINGRKIELIQRDSKTDPTQAVRAANQLIRSDKVIGIFGATTGSGTLSFVSTAANSKIPVIPPNATAELTDPSKDYARWVFRDAPAPGDSYPFFLKKIAADGAKTLAVFYQEDAYGESSFELVQDLAGEHGLQVVSSASAMLDASDVNAQMIKLLNAKPDAVLMITSAAALSGLVLRTVGTQGYGGRVYGAEGGGQKAVIEAAEGNTDNFVAPLLVNPDEPEALPELHRLMSEHGGLTGYSELLGAEAIAIFEAGLKTGAETGEELRKAINNAGPIKGYGTVPAQYTKDDRDGFPAENYRWAVVKDGKFVFEE